MRKGTLALAVMALLATSKCIWSGETVAEWGNGALKVSSGGFQNNVTAAEVAALPYRGDGGNVSLAFPWRGRIVEFALPTANVLERIELELDKFNKSRPETEAGMDNARLYTSIDGRAFTETKAEISTKYHEKEGVLYARVTMKGPFYGKFFRIATDWDKDFYVYRFNGFMTHFNAIGQYADLKLTAPMIVTGKIPIKVDSDSIAGKTVSLFLDGTFIWKGSAEQMTMKSRGRSGRGASRSMTINPDNLAAGLHELRLEIDNGAMAPFVKTRQFMYDNTRIFLALQHNGDWEEKTYDADGFEVTLLKAKKKGASLTAKVPKTGKYALYATIRGKGGFNLVTICGLCSQAQEKSTNVFLQMEHPNDLLETTTGEAFLGIFPFMDNPATITLNALDAGAEIGGLSISPVTDDEIEEYYAEKVVKPSAIIHSDGYSDFFAREITQKELEDRAVAFKKANAFALDWCVGTTAVNYPSRIATMFGQQKDVRFWRNGDRLAAERLAKLLKESGSDPIRILRDKTREQDLRFSVTVRANPWYASNESALNAEYLSQHTEWWMTDVDGKRKLKPSYAYQGVRDFYMGIIKEVIEYRPDAITIEFLRHPPFFGFDEPLVNAYREKYGQCTRENYMDARWLRLQADVMTEWLRQVRKAIDAIDPKIALEINFDCDNYYKHGIDVENLLKEGLLDMISPGYYNIGTQKFFPLKPFVEMAKASPRKVLIFPRIEATIMGGDPTPEEEKGLVKILRRSLSVNQFIELMHDFERDGADGLRPFNAGGATLAEALSNKTDIQNFNKYVRPLLQLRTESE